MLLVVNFSDVKDKDINFSNFLKTFFSMFNNLEEIKDSFMLIITHAPQKLNAVIAIKKKISQFI